MSIHGNEDEPHRLFDPAIGQVQEGDAKSGLGPTGRRNGESAGDIDDDKQGRHVGHDIEVPDVQPVSQPGHGCQEGRLDHDADLSLLYQ